MSAQFAMQNAAPQPTLVRDRGDARPMPYVATDGSKRGFVAGALLIERDEYGLERTLRWSGDEWLEIKGAGQGRVEELLEGVLERLTRLVDILELVLED